MIFLTGATGYLGSKIVQRLLNQQAGIRCLVLPGDPAAALPQPGVEIVRGDVTHLDTFAAEGRGVDTIVHCAALMPPAEPERIERVNVGGTANMVRFAQSHGIRRFIYLSAVSAVYRHKNAYGTSKAEAERLVAASGLDYTILRPTMIYGSDGGLHFNKLVSLIRRVPVLLPILGAGTGRLQPVWVEDVLSAVELALSKANAVGRTYNVSGETIVTFDDFVGCIATALGLRRIKVHVPLAPCLALSRLLSPITKTSFFSVDALSAINEDATIDYAEFARDCAYAPVALAVGLAFAFAPREVGPELRPTTGDSRASALGR